uniref:Uncharacterized protein n=1 Tax=Parascaris univalens TaxID=6257 RepID=A0A915C2W7_PARUN
MLLKHIDRLPLARYALRVVCCYAVFASSSKNVLWDIAGIFFLFHTGLWILIAGHKQLKLRVINFGYLESSLKWFSGSFLLLHYRIRFQ